MRLLQKHVTLLLPICFCTERQYRANQTLDKMVLNERIHVDKVMLHHTL